MVNAELQDPTPYWSPSLGEELLRFLIGRTRCPDVAADLTHEVYLGLQRSAAREMPENPRALAYRIAINLVLDYQRKLAVRNRYLSDIDLDEAGATLPDLAQEPTRVLIGRERLQKLREALGELPVDCRTAFLLHSVEDLTYTQIAARLGVSKSQVNKLLAKAMAHCALRVGD